MTEESSAMKDVRARLGRLADATLEHFVQVERLGREHGFGGAEMEAKSVLQMLAIIDPDRLSQLRSPAAKEVSAALHQTEATLAEVRKAKPTADGKRSSEASIRALQERLFTSLTGFLGYSIFLDRAPQEAKLVALSEQLRDENRAVRRLREDAERLVQGLRDEGGEQGLEAMSVSFSQRARRLNEAAKIWIGATVVCLFCAVASSVVLSLLADVSTGVLAARLAALAGLFYGAGFCARGYRATRHNAEVYEHRALSLSVYRRMVEACAPGANRDLVLTSAAQAVFGAQPTGFSSDSVSPGGTPQVIAGVQSFIDKASAVGTKG